jgi:predicted PurR-regulated permease PerM
MLAPTTPSPYAPITRWVVIAILLFLMLAGAWIVRGILLLTLASIILVVLLQMPVRRMVRRGVPRPVAIILALAFIIVIMTALTLFALPQLVQQFVILATVNIPQGVEELLNRWASGDIQRQFPILAQITTQDIENFLNQASTQILSAIGAFGVSVLPVLGNVADTLLSLLIVLFMSMYLIADPESHRDGAIRLLPKWYRLRGREILDRCAEALRAWLKATIVSMFFVGVLTWIGLSLVGLQQALVLGVIAGITSFIPNFGPLIALIPSIAVGLIQAPDQIGWIILVVYGVSFIQTQIMIPLLVAGSIRLPPVLVLLGQIIAGVFFGFLGIMLAVPITAILLVLVQEIYVKDVLGDRGGWPRVSPESASLVADAEILVEGAQPSAANGD